MDDQDEAQAIGYRQLACAVLLQAWRDAHSRNGAKAAREAGIPKAIGLAGAGRQFLASDAARWLVIALDIDPAGLEQVLAALPAGGPVQLLLFDLFDMAG